jgi:hypothetical protein
MKILIEKNRWLKEYRSADGLGRLDLQDTKPSQLPNIADTVKNDNGILFAFYFYLICIKAGCFTESDRTSFETACHLLEREPGLFNRRPNEPESGEAHDNPGAIAAGSVFMGLHFAEDIVKYGNKHGWSFVNQSPGDFRIQQSRQGGEVGYLKVCAGYRPALWEWLWFLIGLFINAFQGPDQSSNKQLAWMRVEAITKAFDKFDYSGTWAWVWMSFVPVKLFWWIMFWIRCGTMHRVFKGYYFREGQPEHPQVTLSRIIDY